MQVTVEEIGPITKKLKVVMPAAEATKELDAAFRKLQADVQLKGFRKGKAPRSLLEKTYGEQVRAEVSEKLVQASYFDALEQQRVDAVTHPEIKAHGFEPDGSFFYEAEVDTRPEFELKDYKGIEVEKAEPVVEDSEVDQELARLRREMAPLRSVEDRGAAAGDLVIVAFQGYHEGMPISQVHSDDSTIDIGSGRNGREFEDKLIGLKKGEHSAFTIDFPPGSANPVLAGKSIEFRLDVKEVKERVLAALDDEFAKDMGSEFETLAALKDHIREKIRRQKDELLEGRVADKLMAKLLADYDFPVPARLVQYEVDEYLKVMEKQLQASGLSFETAGLNREVVAARYREVAEKRVRGDFLIKKIAATEGIKVAEEDLNTGFARLAEQYQMTVNEVKGYFRSREDTLPFISEMLNEKVVKFLREAAVIKPVTANEAEQTEPGQSIGQATGQADAAPQEAAAEGEAAS